MADLDRLILEFFEQRDDYPVVDEAAERLGIDHQEAADLIAILAQKGFLVVKRLPGMDVFAARIGISNAGRAYVAKIRQSARANAKPRAESAVAGSMRIDGVEGTPRSRSVLVVYGRNERLRRAMFTFLRAIGLRPIEWGEAVRGTGEASPYVGTILDWAFANSQAVVVLLSPDDEARLRADLVKADDPAHERDLTGQPRLNVVLEAGMAMGKDAKRTLLIQFGVSRPISDLTGRHVVRFSETPEMRKEIAQRLEAAGCAVTLLGTDWLCAGDFVPEVDRVAFTATQSPPPQGAGPVRESSEVQMGLLYGLIMQMPADEMWLSQIFQRGASAFDGVPAARGAVNYITTTARLADSGKLEILQRAHRSFKDFYGEPFPEDIYFRRLRL